MLQNHLKMNWTSVPFVDPSLVHSVPMECIMGGRSYPTQSHSVLSFFLLHHLGTFIHFAYFNLHELHCISNSFIFFPLSLIHLIFNPLLLHFLAMVDPLRVRLVGNIKNINPSVEGCVTLKWDYCFEFQGL